MNHARISLALCMTVLASILAAAPRLAYATDPGDRDADGILDDTDNCVRIKNATQVDADLDGVGDACDECLGTRPDVPIAVVVTRRAVDPFGCSVSQRCPCDGPRTGRAPWRHRSTYMRCVHGTASRLLRLRLLGARERRALLAQAKASRCGLTRGVPGDRDGDGVLDDGDGDGIAGNHRCASRITTGCDDNCRRRRNRDQVDLDGDGRGNRCDFDLDGDQVKNRRDNCPRRSNPTQDDGDGDEVGDACDDCKDSEDGADVGRNGCD